MARVQIDFMGMCVAIKEDGRITNVGLLNEKSHIHFLHFYAADGSPAIALLKGAYTLERVKDTGSSIVGEERLPDIAKLADVTPDRDHVARALSVTITLPKGKFETLEPVRRSAEGPWDVGKRDPVSLTDRCRFVSETEADSISFKSDSANETVEIPILNGEIRATVHSLDNDISGTVPLRAGYLLTEFALLYNVVGKSGPIPQYGGRDQILMMSDPGNPICPAGLVSFG